MKMASEHPQPLAATERRIVDRARYANRYAGAIDLGPAFRRTVKTGRIAGRFGYGRSICPIRAGVLRSAWLAGWEMGRLEGRPPVMRETVFHTGPRLNA
jgi:ribosome modulation factor